MRLDESDEPVPISWNPKESRMGRGLGSSARCAGVPLGDP